MASEETKPTAQGTESAPTLGQRLHGGTKAPDDATTDDPTQLTDDASDKQEKLKELDQSEKQEDIERQENSGQDGDLAADKEAKESPQNTEDRDIAQDKKLEQASKEEASGTEKKEDEKKDKKKDDKPAGGYDSMPVPKRPRGWTVRITIHRAINLPMADINTLSSDPYVISQIYTDTPNRHKEDPPMFMRTPTVRRNTDPVWDWPWTIANVPSSGFKLKVRMYDEDPSNHDDRLGNVHIRVPSMGEDFENIKERAYKIEKRSGSKRAYFIRAVTRCFGRVKHMHGELFVSIELLGRTAEDGQDGRLYTVGPCWWTKHFSPMLGRIANTRDNNDDDGDDDNGQDKAPKASGGERKKKKQTQRYNFQANQLQLAGPVPKELYHRFVEFKPWVQRMFTKSGILGFLTAKALHAQHDRVYHFDLNTKWGRVPEDTGTNLTKLFLDHVHYDQGARIFTYIISLDGLWRFTETGKEFGIDMLSKHTMHSNVGIYIAFSGEFFIRRLKKPREPPPPAATEETSQSHPPDHEPNETHPPNKVEDGPPTTEGPKDPKYYELVIDNDSGTYRPNADLLPLLKKYLALHLPGLHILTLDCQKDAKRMNKMKDEQRERKKAEGDGIIYLQGDNGSSISSSDEEDLDAMVAAFGSSGATKRQRGSMKTAAKGFKTKEEDKVAKIKREYAGKKRHDTDELISDEVLAGGDAGVTPPNVQASGSADRSGAQGP